MITSEMAVEEKYEEAIQSLKKINDELFYKELKELIKQRESTIVEKNEEVFESIDKMRKMLLRFPVQLSEQFKEEVIIPQAESFDQAIDRLNGNLADMEGKVGEWSREYQHYLQLTEKLLTEIKEIQRDDKDFVQKLTQTILDTITEKQEQMVARLQDGFNRQMAQSKHQSESALQEMQKEFDHLNHYISVAAEKWDQKYQHSLENDKELQKEWDEKWRKASETSAEKEKFLKKLIIGLVVGQGVSLVLLGGLFFL